MDKLDKIIRKVVPQKTYGEAARSAEICFIAEGWSKCCFKAISYSNGVLKLSAQSSSAASELHIIQDELIEFVNTKIGRKTVRTVRIINRG
ncbi:MAG: DciA family protein [Candidatus Berkelbacteria bacterium]